MKTYIALFRAINVGGKNLLPMTELVAILETLGAKNVSTYGQSGNAVLQWGKPKVGPLSGQITAAIKQQRGFEPYVLLLERDAFLQAIAHNPFPEAETEPASVHLGFLAATPEHPDLAKLTQLKAASERFILDDKVFYLHAPDGVGRSKLAANSEKYLGVTMTDRNWKTVCKIRDLLEV